VKRHFSNLMVMVLTLLSVALFFISAFDLVEMITDNSGGRDMIWVDEKTGAWGRLSPSEFQLWRLKWEVTLSVLSITFTLLPFFRLRRYLRELNATRRLSMLRCPSCGYDLRATPDRCPECGKVPEKVNSKL
jgi:hypothetical protein